MGYALQVEGLNQLVHCKMATEIGLVTQDQEWDALHGWLLKENVKLFFGYWQSFLVGRVDDKSEDLSALNLHPRSGRPRYLHYRIYAATIPFPHRSKSRLATEIPAMKLSATLRV